MRRLALLLVGNRQNNDDRWWLIDDEYLRSEYFEPNQTFRWKWQARLYERYFGATGAEIWENTI
jgi:hypothetical protein